VVQLALDRGEAVPVADHVLRDARRVSVDLAEDGGSVEAEVPAELVANELLEGVVVEIDRPGIGRAADPCVHEHLTLRGTTGEERRGPDHPEDPAPLLARNEQAEAAQGVRDLMAPQPEQHDRDVRVGDPADELRERPILGCEEAGGGSGRDGEHEPVGLDALPAGQLHDPARPDLLLDRLGGGARAQAIAETARERVDGLLHAGPEGQELAARSAGAAAPRPALAPLAADREHGPHEAAVLLLELDDARERRRHRQLVHVAREDAGDHRVEQDVHRLVADAPCAELRDRLVVSVAPRRPEGLGGDPQAPARRQELRT
jgi:hypothetical protein